MSSSNSPTILNTLQQAVTGLLWMSESDYPLEVQLWDLPAETPLTTNTLLQQLHKPLDTPVEEIGLLDLFAPAVTERDWHGAEEKAIARQFQTLLNLIQDNLQNVHVFRIGKIAIDVYILGKAESQWIAISTKVIET